MDTNRPSYKAFKILQFGFVAAPVLAGLDKFFNIMVDWTKYLSPVVTNMIDGHIFMQIVGVVEIVAGIIVFVNPRLGGMIVGCWLVGIILNLLTIPAYLDIALRDLGLALGAFALAQLSKEYK